MGKYGNYIFQMSEGYHTGTLRHFIAHHRSHANLAKCLPKIKDLQTERKSDQIGTKWSAAEGAWPDFRPSRAFFIRIGSN
jgi:hypothetical protein